MPFNFNRILFDDSNPVSAPDYHLFGIYDLEPLKLFKSFTGKATDARSLLEKRVLMKQESKDQSRKLAIK